MVLNLKPLKGNTGEDVEPSITAPNAGKPARWSSSHERSSDGEQPDVRLCRYVLPSQGDCKSGDACQYSHALQRAAGRDGRPHLQHANGKFRVRPRALPVFSARSSALSADGAKIDWLSVR